VRVISITQIRGVIPPLRIFANIQCGQQKTKMKITKLKKLIIVIAMVLIAFTGYTIIINRNSVNMTGRQKILKAFYPMIVWLSKLGNKNAGVLTNNKTSSPVSFYTLNGILTNGAELSLATFKGKKILLVNTASDCGYTDQYSDLQKLYASHKDKLVIIGFPANDFKEQEKGSDKDIAQFCKLNYGIEFPLMKKSTVIKSADQHPVFQWLSDPAKNGWNSKAPSWNFSKYLVNEEGVLTHYFGPAVEPMSETIRQAIETK
jgi:glutathione peroxidase